MKLHKKEVEARLKIWRSLLDTSIYLALARMKFKGYSEAESRDRLCKQRTRSSLEHHRANLEIIKKLYAVDIKNKGKGKNKC